MSMNEIKRFIRSLNGNVSFVSNLFYLIEIHENLLIENTKCSELIELITFSVLLR